MATDRLINHAQGAQIIAVLSAISDSLVSVRTSLASIAAAMHNSGGSVVTEDVLIVSDSTVENNVLIVSSANAAVQDNVLYLLSPPS